MVEFNIEFVLSSGNSLDTVYIELFSEENLFLHIEERNEDGDALDAE